MAITPSFFQEVCRNHQLCRLFKGIRFFFPSFSTYSCYLKNIKWLLLCSRSISCSSRYVGPHCNEDIFSACFFRSVMHDFILFSKSESELTFNGTCSYRDLDRALKEQSFCNLSTKEWGSSRETHLGQLFCNQYIVKIVIFEYNTN